MNFIKERSSSIVAFYQQNSRVGHGLDSELVQDVAGKFTTEETCRMLDGLLVIFLTCLSYAHQALGEEVEALLLHSARIKLQKVDLLSLRL